MELDPKNASAYNDRALAETNIDQFNQAIGDLTKAIQIKEMTPSQSSLASNMSYQNRADAYMKAGDYPNAIADYSRAIGREFASLVFLMSVEQIHTIYPELSSVSDQDLLEGLRQKYFADMTSIDFNSSMVKNKSHESSILADLYAARGDAYAKNGDTHKAAAEYARALHSFSQYQLKDGQQAIYNGF